MKEKSRSRRTIRAVGAVALLAVAVWVISLIAESFGFMPFASYEKRAVRFAARCAPQWEAALEELAAAGGEAERGESMPDRLKGIFGIDRTLSEIWLNGENEACFRFEWYITGPEKDTYVYWQKNDDFRKLSAVEQIMSWHEQYGEQIETEETENGFRLTGFGMGKKGYLHITRLRPCWFIAEGYNPT